MTLDEFLALEWQQFPRNAWVSHPDFKEIYVRRGSIAFKDYELDCVVWVNAITIASIEAKHPGKGAFSRLTKELIKRGYVIYVENVHNPRFRKKLINLGYARVNKMEGPNYIINYEGKTTRELQRS